MVRRRQQQRQRGEQASAAKGVFVVMGQQPVVQCWAGVGAVGSDVAEIETRVVPGVSGAVTATGVATCVSAVGVGAVTVIETAAAAAAAVFAVAVAWTILSEGLQQ